MARITVEDCIDKFESRFELVLVASNRARKLHSGESPTVEKDNDKNTVIALREIADETISIDDIKNSLIEEYQTVSPQSEEDLLIENSDSENEKDNDGSHEDEINEEEDLLKLNEDAISDSLAEEEGLSEKEVNLSEEEISTVEEEALSEQEPNISEDEVISEQEVNNNLEDELDKNLENNNVDDDKEETN